MKALPTRYTVEVDRFAKGWSVVKHGELGVIFVPPGKPPWGAELAHLIAWYLNQERAAGAREVEVEGAARGQTEESRGS